MLPLQLVQKYHRILLRWFICSIKSSCEGWGKQSSSFQPGIWGKLSIPRPIRSWMGVSGSFKSSWARYSVGQWPEFNIASTSMTTVNNSLYVIWEFLITFLRPLLALWIMCSKMPSHQWKFSTLNCQLSQGMMKWVRNDAGYLDDWG